MNISLSSTSDQNNDNTPDRVYGYRVNGLGQIVDRRMIDFTIGGTTSKP